MDNTIEGKTYELVGQGSYGVVVKVGENGTAIALKLIPDNLSGAILEAEATTLAGIPTSYIDPCSPKYSILQAALEHSRLLKCSCIEISVLQMPFIEGVTLCNFVDPKGITREKLFTKNQVDPNLVKNLLVGAANRMDHAKYNGVVHRDIKPNNIIVSNTDYKTELIDYGTSLIFANGEITGLVNYIPSYGYYPGSFDNDNPDIDFWYQRDIKALGLIFCEIMCGKKILGPMIALHSEQLDIDEIKTRIKNEEVINALQMLFLADIHFDSAANMLELLASIFYKQNES